MVESPQEFSVQLGPNFGHRDRVVLTSVWSMGIPADSIVV